MNYAPALDLLLVLSPFIAAALLMLLVVSPARDRFWRHLRETYRDAPPPGRFDPPLHDDLLYVATCVLLVLALFPLAAAYRALEPSDGYSSFGIYAWLAAGAVALIAIWQFGVPWLFFRYWGARCPQCGAAMPWEIEGQQRPHTDATYLRYRCLRCATEISTRS